MAFPVLAMAIGAGIGGLYTKASGGSNRDMIKNMFLGATLGATAGSLAPGLLGGAGVTGGVQTASGAMMSTAANPGVTTGLAKTLGLSAGKAKLVGGAALASPFLMGSGQQTEGGIKPLFSDEEYAMSRTKADEQIEGLGDRFNYAAAPDSVVENPSVYALAEGGIVNALPKYKEGGNVQYLPSKLDHDEKDVSNYVRASGYIEDATDIADKDEDTMLAQLADGEFVSRADAVLGAGIMSGANPKNFKEMRKKGAKYFYNQQDQLKRIYDMVS
tara:strand:- start:17 stop:835 length:819 start_codon:yes stop_codon:yes gene_type:complete